MLRWLWLHWPKLPWRLVKRHQHSPPYVPDPERKRRDMERLADILGRVDILEHRRDVQLRRSLDEHDCG